MKKLTFKFALLFFVTLLASCVEKDYYITEAPEEPKDESTYTIMMYGCGGGNLDLAMVTNIREALLVGSTDRVKFTGQVKVSSNYQEYEETAGTQRFIVGSTPENWYTPVEVLDSELALYDPQNLTNFINWSKEQCPADEYILLLWNHGGGWKPSDDAPKNRAIVYDDVLAGEGLTLDDLVKGIKDSGTKMKMVYFDACLMGMVEIMAGITECADYALAASHVTTGLGGDYNSLMHHLNNSTNFEEAIKEYCFETMSHWNVEDRPYDLTLVDLSKMDNLLKEIKVFSGYLKEIAQIAANYAADPDNGSIDEGSIYGMYTVALNNCYMYYVNYEDSPFFDLQNFAEIFSNCGYFNSYSAKMVDIASRLKRAFNEAIVCKQLSNAIAGALDLSLAVTIVHDEMWEEYGYHNAYPGLKVQQATNWGNWLSINPLIPTGNPNPSTFGGEYEEEEGEGEEGEDEEGEGIEDQLEMYLQLVLEIIRNR